MYRAEKVWDDEDGASFEADEVGRGNSHSDQHHAQNRVVSVCC